MLGTALTAAGVGLLTSDSPLWMIYTGLAAAGVSCAMFASPNTAIIMVEAGEENYSMASSVLSTMRSFGHSLSMASASAASSVILGVGKLNESSGGEILLVMKYTLFFWSGLCLLGFFIALPKKI
jgi:hypothetical protein